jgi:peptidoglycan/xylan/chitin deacetylase (PgdA/CDA1 family)
LFGQQIEWLARNGWKAMSCEALVAAIRRGLDLHKTVVLTFDDAFCDFYDTAMPVLERFGFQATVFVVTGKVGQASDWNVVSPRRPVMSESQLARVAAQGHELGSHTVTHASLPELDDAALGRELGESLAYLKGLTGRESVPFAYPYGRSGGRERRAVREAGYTSAHLAGGLWGNGRGSDVLALTRDVVARDTSLRQFARLVRGETDVARLLRDLARRRRRP